MTIKSLLLGNKSNTKFDLTIVITLAIVTYLIASYFNLSERWFDWTHSEEYQLELYQADEIIFVLLVLSASLIWFSRRRYTELQSILQQNIAITLTLKKNNREVAELLTQNRALIKHITQVREAERSHLASELHDVFGQYLAAIDVNASTALKQTKADDKTYPLIKTIQDSANYLREVTRSQLRSIKPPSLESIGLSAAINELLAQWLISFPGYQLSLSIDVNDEWVEYDTALTIYRCLQEGLSNIVRHASASRISIDLATQLNPALENEIRLMLQDDGIGLDPAVSLGKGLGLIGIRERVTALSGHFHLYPAKPQGTALVLIIPL
ncbi:MAG: two-component sensor histidine kinase [Methylophaga sp.]|nr:MAG: two-component sensor histidine kinase [Methylophaga sp.]